MIGRHERAMAACSALLLLALMLLALLLLALMPATAMGQYRPRALAALAVGVEQVTCNSCREPDRTILGVTIEAGVSHVSNFSAAARFSALANVDLIQAAPYTTSLLAAVAGYQVHNAFGVYGGAGRHMQHWNAAGVSSSGLAVLAGVEAVLGRRTGFGARVHAEVVQAFSGQRTSDLDGFIAHSKFRPRIIQAGIGLIWR